MHRMATTTLIAVLITTLILVSAGNVAAFQSGPPPVAPSWGTSGESDGCSSWSGAGTVWQYQCVMWGDAWVYQESYYWDSDRQVAVLYYYSFFDWVDLWFWDCSPGRACQA